MFVKQITLEEALRLAANGNEVMTLVPGEEKSDWREMIPDTLQNMLSGVMFFQREPALEKPMIDSEEDPPPQPRTDEAVVGGKGKKKKPIDTGKMLALRKAGWSMKKIGDELGISESSVFNYLKKLEQEGK